jgi:hypothetical protein
MSFINTTENPYQIKFIDELAREQMRSLNVGDTLFGETVPQNSYITEVNYDGYYVIINNELGRDGEKLITYELKLNSVGLEDPTDFYHYRYELKERGLLDAENPFDHGLYNQKINPRQYPFVSSVII